MNRQLSLFENQRIDLQGSIDLSLMSLAEYGQSLTLAEAEAALLAAQPVNGRGNGKGKG